MQAELLRSEAAAQQIAKKEVDFYRTEMFRIDESTPSIDTMEITMSDSRIKQSEEYLFFGQDILKMIENKEIIGDEGREMLDNKVEELKRRMDKRRKREARRSQPSSTATRKKVERDYESLKKKGWDSRDFGMEVVMKKHGVGGANGMYWVDIPDVSEFYTRALQMQSDILAKQTKPLQRPQHYCMASVGLQGAGGKFYTKTSHTPVLTPDGKINEDFYVKLCVKVETLLDRAPDYEERNTEIVCCNITMTYTISQWESIKNWYPKSKSDAAFPKDMKFLDFTVFLASNEDIGCEEQCVEYLNNIFYAIKDWSDLDKVLDNWVKIRSRTVEEYSEKAIEYCSIDVLALQQIWNKFNKLVQENLDITIARQTFTLSQLSMKLMEATLPKNVW
ncbi:hypothetical protein GGI17_006637, partial [Coemansia sp. S146]